MIIECWCADCGVPLTKETDKTHVCEDSGMELTKDFRSLREKMETVAAESLYVYDRGWSMDFIEDIAETVINALMDAELVAGLTDDNSVDSSFDNTDKKG